MYVLYQQGTKCNQINLVQKISGPIKPQQIAMYIVTM